MSEWITDRPPTEALKEQAVLVTTRAGRVASAWRDSVINQWGEDGLNTPVAWQRFPEAYVPPKSEMPDRIWAWEDVCDDTVRRRWATERPDDIVGSEFAVEYRKVEEGA